MRPPCWERHPGWMQGQKGAPLLHLLPRCSAPLRIRPGDSGWANKTPDAHQTPGTTTPPGPLSHPGAGRSLLPRGRREHPASGRCPPACAYVPGREAMPALALAGGAAVSGGAGSAPRPPPQVTRGRGRQRTCQLLWKTAGRKAALFAAPGSGASTAWARASRHSPPRGGSTAGRRRPGVAQVGSSQGWGLFRQHGTCPNPGPITQPLICTQAPSPPATTGVDGPRFC